MKRIFISLLVMVMVLVGCVDTNSTNDKKPDEAINNEFLLEQEYKKVEPVGNVPDEFKRIVEENLFKSIYAYEDRLLDYDFEYTPENNTHTVTMLDFYGNVLASYTRTDDNNMHFDSLIATSDGGFLFALGFSDSENPDGTWESEKGVVSKVIKCDSSGNLQWEVKLENYSSSMLSDCIEVDNAYYFFGEQETPETKMLGVYSPTDIHITKMSADGEMIQTKVIGGSDYDMMYSVLYEPSGTFILYCKAQSTDGDFSPSSEGLWEMTLDTDFNILNMTEIDHDTLIMSYRRECVGTLDGRDIFIDDSIFHSIKDGSIVALIDYGEFYLVVSSNMLGYIENELPIISAKRRQLETVYGAYDKNGNVLWKATSEYIE